MLPKTNSNLMTDFEYETLASKTYKLDIDKNYIKGYCDKLVAIKQAIYKILNTERYENIIYSWNYGIELNSLYGRDISYVISELKRRVKEALTQDDRIDSVDNFKFNNEKGKIIVTFTVHTNIGEIEEQLEVLI